MSREANIETILKSMCGGNSLETDKRERWGLILVYPSLMFIVTDKYKFMILTFPLSHFMLHFYIWSWSWQTFILLLKGHKWEEKEPKLYFEIMIIQAPGFMALVEIGWIAEM